MIFYRILLKPKRKITTVRRLLEESPPRGEQERGRARGQPRGRGRGRGRDSEGVTEPVERRGRGRGT